MFRKKLQAYALPFAVFISVVIIILSSTLILAAHYNNRFYNRIIIQDKLNSNVSSAINLLLANPDMLDEGSEKTISLYGETADSVKMEKDSWGIFDLFTVTSFHQRLQVKRSVMAGNYAYNSGNVAFFVSDHGQPVSVAGNVNIQGNTILPESGFKQANIEGKTFTGRRIADHEMQKSKQNLPPLNDNIARLDNKYFVNKYLNDSSIIIPFEEIRQDSIVVSFLDTITVLYSPNTINLNYIFLSGKIIVLSGKEIEINNTSQLTDIICVAPYIKIEDGFSGKLQILAQDSVSIGKDCNLKYPSVVGVISNKQIQKAPYLNIGENTTVCGISFIYRQSATADKQPFLRLGKGSVLKGQAYSNGYAEIKGSIHGSLYTDRFFLSTPSAIYENTIMDADIDIYKLSSSYVGMDLIGEDTHGSVIKWVY
jgi:cytoskeletal protein CcmA (bactofilin family)